MASKNVLILKELESGFNTGRPLSGIIRIELESGIAELSASLINLARAFSGELYLFIFGKTSLPYTLALENRTSSLHKILGETTDFSSGFASALVLVKDDIPLTLAFGKTDECAISLSNVKKLIAEKCLTDRKNAKRKSEISEPATSPPIEEPPSAPLEPQPTTPEPIPVQPIPSLKEQVYNDEAVATENYFEIDDELKDKLNLVKENEKLSNADGKTANTCQEEEKTSKSRTDFLSNEENLFSGEIQKPADNRPFYLTAEKELKTLFEKFPPYDNLKCYFPDSKWVKISYDNDRYYIVGVIKEEGKEKYICYGVPENYSPEPPKELKGYCTFIPLSIFDMQGAGFWMMFQDAISGECITPTTI